MTVNLPRLTDFATSVWAQTEGDLISVAETCPTGATSSTSFTKITVIPDSYADMWWAIPAAMQKTLGGDGGRPLATESTVFWTYWPDPEIGFEVVVPFGRAQRERVLDDLAEFLGWDIVGNTGRTATLVEPEGSVDSVVQLLVHVALDESTWTLHLQHNAEVRTVRLDENLDRVAATFVTLLADLDYTLCVGCEHVRRAEWSGAFHYAATGVRCLPCQLRHADHCDNCTEREIQA